MIKQILANGGDPKPNSEECSSDYLYFLLDEVARDTLKASTSRPLAKSLEGLSSDQPRRAHSTHAGSGVPQQADRPGIKYQLEHRKISFEKYFWKTGGHQSNPGSQDYREGRALTLKPD